MDNLGNTPTQRREDNITSTTVTVRDSGDINLGESAGGADDVTYPCVTMLFTAGSALNQHDVVKMIDDGSGNPVVFQMQTVDSATTGVVGTTNEAAIIGQEVEVCVGGSFKAIADSDVVGISIGDVIRFSTLVNGAVNNTTTSTRAFGISMSDASPGEILTGVFIKNEVGT